MICTCFAHNSRYKNLQSRENVVRMSLTRESLVAEWQRICPADPMSLELQELVLSFANAAAARPVAENQRPILVQAQAPPPQRFQRHTPARSQDTAPPGPSKGIFVQDVKTSTLSGASFNSLPQGPGDFSSWDQRDELDLAFGAINRS